MSQPNTKLPFTKRKAVLRENVGKLSYTKIAEKCGIDRRTLYRDIEKLKKQGIWFQWIEDRFTDLLADTTIDPAKKLIELGKLYGKQFTNKHEVETTGDIVFKLESWRPSDADSTDKVSPT